MAKMPDKIEVTLEVKTGFEPVEIRRCGDCPYHDLGCCSADPEDDVPMPGASPPPAACPLRARPALLMVVEG